MKLSIFTTATNPFSRGDLWLEPMKCYTDLADEVIVVNGGGPLPYPHPKVTVLDHHWPQVFDWKLIGEQFQRGYEAATGDWVIHMDLDFLFHEQDYDAIRYALESNASEPALSFWKYQLIRPTSYHLKSRLVLAVNKKMHGDSIRFDGGGDLCQPTLNGRYLNPDNVKEAKIPIWNYECLLKTEKQLRKDKGRFARAWHKTFGNYKLGGPSDDAAYDSWRQMIEGRLTRHQTPVELKDHPAVMQPLLKKHYRKAKHA